MTTMIISQRGGDTAIDYVDVRLDVLAKQASKYPKDALVLMVS
jgi:hypothetical protein